MRRASAVVWLALVTALTSLTMSGAAALRRARYLMGTVCEISVADSPTAQSQIDSAFSEAERLEHLLTTWSDASELGRLNAAPDDQPFAVSPELYDALRASVQWSQKTSGAFNPLVRPLMDAWQTRGSGRLPSAQEVAEARSRTALINVAFLDGYRMIKHDGARFEEGGFGKGLALDRMLHLLDGVGARRVIIDFGGQIAVSKDMRRATAAIARPDDRSRPAISVTIPAGSLSTSSGSEKHFAIGGRRYSHIIDPRTGSPIDWRGSVSVFAFSAYEADVLSTALFVMKPHEGLRWAEANGVAALFLIPSSRHPGRFEGRRSSKWLALVRESVLDDSAR